MDLSILQIKVITSLGEFEGDLQGDLVINEGNLTESFVDQPGKYAWYAVLSSSSEATVEELKYSIDAKRDYINKTLYGKLDTKVREDLDEEGEKVTETKVTSRIYQEVEYINETAILNDLRAKYIEAVKTYGLLKAAREAMIHRKDMLVSLGAYKRAGIDNNELFIKSEEITDKEERVKKVLSNKTKKVSKKEK